MKRFLLAASMLMSMYGMCQTVPVFKQGTKMEYSIVTDQGEMSIAVKVDSLSPAFLRLKWSSGQIGTGTWEITSKSLQSATAARWSQLEPDATVTLPENECLIIVSKAQWASIQSGKKMELDMVSYAVKKNPEESKLNGKSVNAIYLESADGTSKLWLVDNEAFPAILKIRGNKAGPDIELKTVE
jgi:hypothetical protein